MFQDLYKKIQSCCGYVTVFEGDEIISEGTCFSFNPNGEVITAAHVVTGRMPIKKEDYTHPQQKIIIKFPELPLVEYAVTFCSFEINTSSFKEPIQLDIAVLHPKEEQTFTFPFLAANINSLTLGQRVFIAGYSDELKLPFSIEKIIDPKSLGADKFIKAIKEEGYLADMTGPMIKQGYVGNIRRIYAEDSSQNIKIETDVFYIDNGMHSGASGGPIVNEKGIALGVLTQRAITPAHQSNDSKLEVPSGSSIGISLQILQTVNDIIKKNNTPTTT